MADQPETPVTTPVTDRRPVPRGVLPRGVQTWLMAGLAAAMLLIIVLTGRPDAPAPVRTAPTPLQTASPDRVRDYQDRLRLLEAQAVQEAQAISPADNRVIAVTDREGHVLAVWDVNGAAAPNPTPTIVADVVSKAGAAAFLSSNQHAFTSRTAAFIVQNHFPPDVKNRPNGPLVGVNFSNMAFSDTNKFKAPSAAGTFPSPPVP